MELRTLRVFVEVVRQGGFTEAARTVGATQSTVSKAVKQLEDELGLMLLDRVGHRSSLTSAGEIVFRRAQRLLAERDDLVTELDELRGLKRGMLRLGLPPIGSDVLFAPVFAAFRARYPGVEIRLVEHGSKRLEEVLHAGEVDLAGVLLPIPEDFAWQRMRHEPIVALVPADHRLAGRRALSMVELAEEPFVLFEAGFALNPIIQDVCARAGFVPRVAARSSQIGFIVELVAAGLGIAFLPRMIAELRAQHGLRVVPVTDAGMDWQMALAWRRGGYLPQAAKAWLELAKVV